MKSSQLILVAVSLLTGGLIVAGFRLGGGSPQDGKDSASLAQAARDADAKSSMEPKNSSEVGSEAVPSLVRQIMDPSLHLDAQLKAIRSLPSDLSEQELAALVDILRQDSPANVTHSAWSNLINEVMVVLREPRMQWPAYGQELASIMSDRHLDPITRDYAAQHLALWLARPQPYYPADSLPEGMDAFLQVLKGSREAHEPVTGTILLSLCNLRSNQGAEVFSPYADALGATVHDLATQKRTSSLSNQLSAIQAAGRMNFVSVLPTVRDYAQSETVNSSVRLSSIAALGYFGDSEDHSFLSELSQSESKLRFAAQSALKNHSSTAINL